MRWFRFYDEALNDPKVQSLDGETFKVWVNLLCVTSHCDGVIRHDDVSFHLRMPDQQAWNYCKELADRGLLDIQDGNYIPHGWNKRQYKSDTSAERTQRYRDRKKQESSDVSVTSHVTPPEQSRDRADTEQNKKEAATKIDFDFSTGKFLNITTEKLILWKSAYPAISLPTEMAKAASWLMENPKNKKSNYGKFLTNWFSRSQDSAPKAQPQKKGYKMPSPAGG